MKIQITWTNKGKQNVPIRNSNITEQEFNKILENKSTVNLSWHATNKQRATRIRKRKISRHKPVIIVTILALILWVYNFKIVFWHNVAEIEKEVVEVKKDPVLEVNKIIDKIVNVELEAFKLITKFEWFTSKPYWDIKRYSIGYWTPANWRAYINKETAKQEVINRIWDIRKKFNLYSIDDKIEISLISFTYNVWQPPRGYIWYIDKWYINWLKNRMREYKYWWGKLLRGLETRRNYEVSLF